MKKIFTFICALVLSFNISAQTPLTEAVNFQSTAHHGEEINLFEILDNDQFVVLDFFFTTCYFCNEGLPYLIEAYYELGENKEDVYFMEISPTDHNRPPFYFIDKYIEEYSVPFPTIHTQTGGMTGKEIYDMYQIPQCPTLVFIAPDHKIILQDYSVYKTKSTEVVVRDLRRLMKGYYMESLAAPANLTAKAITETAALLSWDEVEGAYRYNIYLDDELVKKDVAETSCVMTNLEVGKEYNYSVKATYFERESELSDPVSVATEEGLSFPSPADVVATPTNDSTIVLAWSPVENAANYNVYRGTELLATVTDTTYTEVGLEAETEYCYVVTSCLGIVESVASDEICATTLKVVVPEEPEESGKLPAPTNLRALVEQDLADYPEYKYKITMMWDRVEGAQGYDVFVNTTAEKEFYFGYTGGNAYIAGSDQETVFEFYVVAFNQDLGLESDPSEVCVVTIVDDAIEEQTSSFNIYPNPVNDMLYIETETEIEEVSIFDVYGRNQNLRSSETQNLSISVDVANLNSGVYFVRIKTENGEVVKRFVKE